MSASLPNHLSLATPRQNWVMRYLLFIAGLGGLLYGIDIGIIAGALPYLEATASTAWHLSAQNLSFIVAAVLLGSVLSSLFTGVLCDWFGRRWIMLLGGLLFVISIPIIALSNGYMPMLMGRLLQGIGAGITGVAVPLYLSETLQADYRGRGTALFQLFLTVGLVAAALIGLYYADQVSSVIAASQHLPAAERLAHLFNTQDHAWRSIFWSCLLPGIIFTLGCFILPESPRWLFQRNKPEAAFASLKRNRSHLLAQEEFSRMQQHEQMALKTEKKETLFKKRYIYPFLLTCLILSANQATGINSILAYVVNILNQAGLPGSVANQGDVLLKVVNVLMTIVALILVDNKGRKFLLKIGTAGVFIALLGAGFLFKSTQNQQVDYASSFQQQVKAEALHLPISRQSIENLGIHLKPQPMQLTLTYSYGPYTNVQTRLLDGDVQAPISIDRTNIDAADSVIGKLFRRIHLNPLPDPALSEHAPLHITKALIGPVPTTTHGWLVAAVIIVFVAFFAVGPGVCVWLVLSELMPTRIRSNGMSIALLLNQFVSTMLAAIFLPVVGEHGYAAMFYFWAFCTLIYFLVVTFLLPETKKMTLEEINQHFDGKN